MDSPGNLLNLGGRLLSFSNLFRVRYSWAEMFSRGFSGLLLISWYLCCSLSSYLVEEKTGMLGSPEPVL